MSNGDDNTTEPEPGPAPSTDGLTERDRRILEFERRWWRHAGAKEEAIDLNQTKVMGLLIPDAELIIMPDTGHFALFEQPEEFTQIVLDYLDAGS